MGCGEERCRGDILLQGLFLLLQQRKYYMRVRAV